MTSRFQCLVAPHRRARTLLIAAPFAWGATLGAQTAPSRRPTLVVLIAVDQMRSDYYNRFADHIHGGLRRLFEHGAVFANAYQDHGITETAPGHAAMLSGRFPVHNGIATNVQGVNTPNESILGGGPWDLGASPFRFNGGTLVDWIRSANPEATFLSVSRKDRGAILPIGPSKGNVYWFATTAEFWISTYYGSVLPAWLRDFNSRRIPWSYRGQQWTPMYGQSIYAEPDSVPAEERGCGKRFRLSAYDAT